MDWVGVGEGQESRAARDYYSKFHRAGPGICRCYPGWEGGINIVRKERHWEISKYRNVHLELDGCHPYFKTVISDVIIKLILDFVFNLICEKLNLFVFVIKKIIVFQNLFKKLC